MTGQRKGTVGSWEGKGRRVRANPSQAVAGVVVEELGQEKLLAAELSLV